MTRQIGTKLPTDESSRVGRVRFLSWTSRDSPIAMVTVLSSDDDSDVTGILQFQMIQLLHSFPDLRPCEYFVTNTRFP